VIRSHHIGCDGAEVTTDHANSSPERASAAGHDEPKSYEIRVKGHLADRWTTWFDGLTIRPEPDGSTVITGPIADQAALHGVLHRLRDVGIPLISLTEVPSDHHHTDGPTSPTIEGN
jgi:hypothetical protein